MSASKLTYRVNKRLTPHLESLGFNKSRHPRDWVRMTDGMMCAVQMVASPVGGRSHQDVTKGSFGLFVGVAHPALNLGPENEIDDPGGSGIGITRVRASLTRSPGHAGPLRPDVWDPSVTSHDEAIDDAIAAIDSQAVPFFDQWTDPEFVYESLLDGEFLHNPEGTSEQGTAELFVWAQRDSMEGQTILSSMAARLGRTKDEIHHLEEANRLLDELTGFRLAHPEAVTRRLNDLRNG